MQFLSPFLLHTYSITHIHTQMVSSITHFLLFLDTGQLQLADKVRWLAKGHIDEV